jgi:hypothetical protein
MTLWVLHAYHCRDLKCGSTFEQIHCRVHLPGGNKHTLPILPFREECAAQKFPQHSQYKQPILIPQGAPAPHFRRGTETFPVPRRMRKQSPFFLFNQVCNLLPTI